MMVFTEHPSSADFFFQYPACFCIVGVVKVKEPKMIHTELSNFGAMNAISIFPWLNLSVPFCTGMAILRSWPKGMYREEYEIPEYSTCLQQICNLEVSWNQQKAVKYF